MRTLARLSAALLLACACPGAARAALNVVTTTEDLAAIAREVGGDRISVVSLARGYQDPHFVDAKPSLLIKLSRADLFVQVGREIEIAWAHALVNNARNPRILPGAPGNLDASAGVAILEIPTGQISRAQGDVHPYGNPHYWLDPKNGLAIAGTLRDALSRLDPAGAAVFNERAESFQERLREAMAGWTKRAESLGLKGMPVVTYHRSWPYFAKAFGLEVVGFIEPKPGIPPSPSHLHDLEHAMTEGKVRLLIVEPFYDIKLPQKIAAETGAKLVVLGPSVGWEKSVQTYFDLFEKNLDILSQSLKEETSP